MENNQNRSDSCDSYSFETLCVRHGQMRSQFREHAEALYLTSSFVFDSAEQAARCFVGEEEGFVYSRFSNPTATMFCERLAKLENAEIAYPFASGMAAIMAAVLGHVQAGDEIIASTRLFGSTIQLFNNVFAKLNIKTTYVPPENPQAWERAVTQKTRFAFLETPANHLGAIADIAAIAEKMHRHGIVVAVDNCFMTPILQRPLDLGADLVIHSATKFIDGQGRVMGGAVCGSKANTEEIFRFLRASGGSMSPFNAWVLLKGLETLPLRMKAHSDNALKIARWLEKQPNVKKVFYPGLESHPQHELAKRQQSAFGAVLSFEVEGGQEAAWRVIDSCKLLSITGNLGDSKTTITHPATTTHSKLSEEEHRIAGITPGLIRLCVGLENVEDIQNDLSRGLSLPSATGDGFLKNIFKKIIGS